jgi:hypothetical protein
MLKITQRRAIGIDLDITRNGIKDLKNKKFRG